MKFIETAIIICFVLTVLLFWATPSHADDLEFWADTTEYTSYALIMADWAQTLQIRDDPNSHEKNAWLYGEQPKRGRVNIAMLVQLGLVYLFNNQWGVSDNTRLAINLGHSVSRFDAVRNNLKLGLEIKF